MERSTMDINEREQKFEIDLADIFFLIKKKIVGIIIFAIIGGAAVGLYTYFRIAPTYKATSKIYIASSTGESVISISDLQIGSNLAADYQELLMSRPVLQSIVTNLDLKFSYENLKSMITISNPTGTRILEISCVSTDAQMSADIATEMANLSIKWLPEIMSAKVPTIVEDALPASNRVGPSYTRNIAIGAIVGAVLFFGICFIQFMLNDTVKDESDVERYFGMTPLTVIPEMIEDSKKQRPQKKASKTQSKK